MNLPTSIHQVIAHFIPGFIFIVIAILSIQDFEILVFFQLLQNIQEPVIIGFIGIAISFFIGLFFDAIRTAIIQECFEPKLNCQVEIYLRTEHKEKIELFEQYYYSYFIFERNICISLFLGFFCEAISACYFHHCLCLPLIITSVFFIMFLYDSQKHKKYMLHFMKRK